MKLHRIFLNDPIKNSEYKNEIEVLAKDFPLST